VKRRACNLPSLCGCRIPCVPGKDARKRAPQRSGKSKTAKAGSAAKIAIAARNAGRKAKLAKPALDLRSASKQRQLRRDNLQSKATVTREQLRRERDVAQQVPHLRRLPPDNPEARDEGPRLIPFSGPDYNRQQLGVPALPTDGYVSLADKAMKMWEKPTKKKRPKGA
jgi:hypothetical protein